MKQKVSMKTNNNLISLININDYDFHEEKYIVYGYGMAGKAIAHYLAEYRNINKFDFCDRDEKKWNITTEHKIFGLEQKEYYRDAFFLIGFVNNVQEKLESALEALEMYGISRERMIFIDMNKKMSEELSMEYTKEYLMKEYENKNDREILKKIEKIVFLTGGFTEEAEKNVSTGGPVGAIVMQKRNLGNSYKDIKIEYPYMNGLEADFNQYAFIVHPIELFKEKLLEYSNTIFMTNDIFQAYSLYLRGRKYCLIYHGQGDIVLEAASWNLTLTEQFKEMIYNIEKVVLKNAEKVLFPSYGAKYFFKESIPNCVEFKEGIALYNTIYDLPKTEELSGINCDKSKITFLSIGRMNSQKGLDRVPDFIEKYVEKNHSTKVRWIVVGDGLLHDKILEKMIKLREKNSNIEFINITEKITHEQVFYLMDISDIYIMLHRVSIFDFSTLEAMYCKKAIILSNIPGNDEYNIENNVLLYDSTTTSKDIIDYIEKRDSYGELNSRVYEKNFTKDMFVQRYYKVFDEVINDVLKSNN